MGDLVLPVVMPGKVIAGKFILDFTLTKIFAAYIQSLGFGNPAIFATFFTGPLGNN